MTISGDFKMRGVGIVVTGGLLLAACSTPYQQMGALGGVRATRITADTVQIAARGNGFTDPDTIQRYALRRAAEETLADGFEFFRIGAELDRTQTGAQSFGYATGSRYAAFGSAFTMPIVRPGQTLMIKMYKGPRPDPMPDGMFDAKEVQGYLAGTPYGQKECKPDASGKIACT